MNSSFELYTKTGAMKLFCMIALPGAISMIASSLWGMFDGVFVGQILGEKAFAALNLGFPFVVVNFSLADLIGVGSSVPISIALGRQDEAEANNYFTCACIMIVIAGAAVGVLLYAAAPFLMETLMGARGELAELSITYIRVYALCSPFTTVIFAVDNFLRICGRIKSSMALNIAMSAIILVMEYLCLSVLHMGIGGSSFAVSSGMIICAVIALWPFWRGKLTLKFCRPRFHGALIRQIIASGSPTFLSNIAERVTSILMNMVLLRFGGDNAVSIYGICLYAGDMIRQLLYGTCDSLQPAIGYNYGAGLGARVRAIVQCCLAAAAVICIGGAALIFFFPEFVVSLFYQGGEAGFLTLSVHALRVYALTYLTRWFAFAIQSFLIALDMPLPATILSVSYAFVFPVVLLALLYPLALEGVWLNAPLTSVIVTAIAVVLLLRMRKKQAHKF